MTDSNQRGLALLQLAGAHQALACIDRGDSDTGIICALIADLGPERAARLIIRSENALAAWLALQAGCGVTFDLWWSLLKLSWGFKAQKGRENILPPLRIALKKH